MLHYQTNCKKQSENDLVIACAIIKKQLKGAQIKKQEELSRIVSTYYGDKLGINISSGYFCHRPELSSYPQPIYLTQSTLLFYGIDLIGTRDLESLLLERCKSHLHTPYFISHLNHSTCRLTYVYQRDAYLVMRMLNVQGNMNTWTQLPPYYVGDIQRRWFVRLAANCELNPTLNIRNRRYYQFKQAKQGLIYYLISKFNIIREYSALQREIGQNKTAEQFYQEQETSSNLAFNQIALSNKKINVSSCLNTSQNNSCGSARTQVIDLCEEYSSDVERGNAIDNHKDLPNYVVMSQKRENVACDEQNSECSNKKSSHEEVRNLGNPEKMIDESIVIAKQEKKNDIVIEDSREGLQNQDVTIQDNESRRKQEVEIKQQNSRVNEVSDLRSTEQSRKNDQLSKMLKMRKTKKIFRQQRVAILDVSSDDNEEVKSKSSRKTKEKRRYLQRKGYLPIFDTKTQFEIDYIVRQIAPKKSTSSTTDGQSKCQGRISSR